MKRNEIYDPLKKSATHPTNLQFKLAGVENRVAITALMAERNPTISEAELMRKTDREIELNSIDPQYRLFVAELDGQVLGICRHFHSDRLADKKIIFPAPSGWYGMGILVSPAFRRQSIARFLCQNRFACLAKQGVKLFYSIVDSENLASIKMHEEFGYIEIQRAQGFLHVKLEGGEGILYQKTI
jgi:RimJ/RimL family protein N-acetyltransferase